MPTYLQATINVRQGKIPKFNATLKEMVPALEAAGWKLVGAYVSSVGRLNEVIDLWEIEDANHVQRALSELSRHPDMGRWAAALTECVEDEHLKLMVKLPYSP